MKAVLCMLSGYPNVRIYHTKCRCVGQNIYKIRQNFEEVVIVSGRLFIREELSRELFSYALYSNKVNQ